MERGAIMSIACLGLYMKRYDTLIGHGAAITRLLMRRCVEEAEARGRCRRLAPSAQPFPPCAPLTDCVSASYATIIDAFPDFLSRSHLQASKRMRHKGSLSTMSSSSQSR